MIDVGFLLCAIAVACAGTCVGFAAGLVPGLHMNNIAAGITAYATGALAFFAALGDALQSESAGLLTCCFISSALVAHMFAESITSAYLGIPAGDVVSVLPAHRLARAGLGRVAVMSSADGSLDGVLLSIALLLPVCLVMGHPLHLYTRLRDIMGFVIVFFSAVMLFSEGPNVTRVAKALVLFLAAGLLGSAVLLSSFYASDIPDFPWIHRDYVQKSDLLLPLFAGLFGIPSLLMSLGSRQLFDARQSQGEAFERRLGLKDYALSLLGGAIVGWLPGMTSGSSATLCSPRTREVVSEDEVAGSSRFIWLYSFISASGAVFSVGALFVILRARSGSMDAVRLFLGDSILQDNLVRDAVPVTSILLSMTIAAWLSHRFLRSMGPTLSTLHRVLCSRRVALLSLLFVASLSLALTGVRGALVMSAAACLGLLPPAMGIRRIQLMGCLLVPIAIGFFT